MFSCSGSLGSDTGFEFLPGVLSYEWYDTPKQHVGIQHLLLVAKHRHADYLLGTSAYQGRKKIKSDSQALWQSRHSHAAQPIHCKVCEALNIACFSACPVHHGLQAYMF